MVRGENRLVRWLKIEKILVQVPRADRVVAGDVFYARLVEEVRLSGLVDRNQPPALETSNLRRRSAGEPRSLRTQAIRSALSGRYSVTQRLRAISR